MPSFSTFGSIWTPFGSFFGFLSENGAKREPKWRPKSLQNQCLWPFWRPFGSQLAPFGHFVRILAPFWILDGFWMKFERILDGFWMNFRWFLWEFWTDFLRFWIDFGWILDEVWMKYVHMTMVTWSEPWSLAHMPIWAYDYRTNQRSAEEAVAHR